nr:uncharacterized protein LOC109162731 [Ipomoea trifida]GLL25190.1 uncharacterized protein LOC109162731 [Ipomoea trifida]
MARNRAHRFWDSFTQSCGLPANLFAGGSTLMGGSDSDLAVLLEPIVLGLTFEASHGDSNEMLGNPTNLEVEELGGVLNAAVIMGLLTVHSPVCSICTATILSQSTGLFDFRSGSVVVSSISDMLVKQERLSDDQEKDLMSKMIEEDVEESQESDMVLP